MLLLLITAAVCVEATDRYVSTDGNDLNTGTITSPFKTLEKALSVYLPGDTIIVRGGSYQLNPSSRLIYKAQVQPYSGETVQFRLGDDVFTLNGTVAFWSDKRITGPTSDTTKPTIRFITKNFDTFTLNYKTIEMSVFDNVGVVKVVLYRNGLSTPVGIASEYRLRSRVSIRWQSYLIPTGQYVMTAYAYDAAGNKSLPASLTVIKR